MKAPKLLLLGAALFAMGLGLSPLSPSPARAQDEAGDSAERKIIRVQRERDDDRDAGYLGVSVQRLTSTLRRARSIPESVEGTLVSGVETDGPADQGGVRRGDVLLEVNRKDVDDPSELLEIVRDIKPGTRVPVSIWRSGSRKTLSVTVGSRPNRQDLPTPPPIPRWEDGDGPGNMPDGSRMQVFRMRRGDLERQLREIQEQLSKLRKEDLARLERQIRQLRDDLERNGMMDRRDRDNDRDRDDEEDED